MPNTYLYNMTSPEALQWCASYSNRCTSMQDVSLNVSSVGITESPTGEVQSIACGPKDITTNRQVTSATINNNEYYEISNSLCGGFAIGDVAVSTLSEADNQCKDIDDCAGFYSYPLMNIIGLCKFKGNRSQISLQDESIYSPNITLYVKKE